MRELLDHPWVKVLLVATAIAMCTFALRETAWVTEPIARALKEVLVPVAVGFAIAYVLTPLVDRIARQGGVRRFVAAGMLFAVVSSGLALAFVLVVPSVVSEGAALTQRVVNGEAWTDVDGDGRYDTGEPFADANGNHVWDRALLASGLTRLEEWRTRLKVRARLAFDEPALAYLAFHADQTAALRAYQDAMLRAARGGEPMERWPTLPPGVEAHAASAAGEWSWPSTPPVAVAEAAAVVAPELRERWQALMRAADAALAERHQALLLALAQARAGGTEALATRLRDAWATPLTPERRGLAKAHGDALEEADRSGQPGAARTLTLLRGEGAVGTATLAALVQQVDDALRGSLQQSPSRLGDWTRAGVANVEWWLSLALDCLLVPIYAFFLILAMPAIRNGVRQYIPLRRRDQIIRIVRDIELVVAAFFRGRLIICTVCALSAWLGLSSLGWFGSVSVPYAALFGIAIGFATTVPLSGILFLIPVVVMTMLQPGATAMHAALVIGVYVLVQALEAVLIPLVMGREVELHPVTLIVALLLCGKLLGILGLILAVPIAATCRILAREYLWPRLRAWAERPPGPDGPPSGPGSDDGTPPPGSPLLRDRAA